MIKAGSDVHNLSELGGESLAWWAAWEGHAQLLRPLQEAGADISVGDNKRDTPLHIAIRKRHLEMVNILLELGAIKKAFLTATTRYSMEILKPQHRIQRLNSPIPVAIVGLFTGVIAMHVIATLLHFIGKKESAFFKVKIRGKHGR